MCVYSALGALSQLLLEKPLYTNTRSLTITLLSTRLLLLIQIVGTAACKPNPVGTINCMQIQRRKICISLISCITCVCVCAWVPPRLVLGPPGLPADQAVCGVISIHSVCTTSDARQVCTYGVLVHGKRESMSVNRQKESIEL